ncbi:MAG: T9SS type A sorting domain-containing protein, partial [Bacteroidota bacterium]
SGNEVSDNFVGTNASGADLGNANEGILVEEAPNNRVGGNTVGFNTDGIVLTGADATGNEISDNFVGTNVSGADLGNSVTGILVSDAPGNTIGGAGAGNVLGHNGFFGINMFSADATGNEVLGNFVGTNASGADLGNGNAGIRVVGAPGNTIGGAGAGEGNVIGFNGRDGILVDAGATDTEVLGNFVGTNASGADLGNQNDGILVLQASGNTVGGAGAGNVVGFNNRGIVLFDASGNAVVGNTVESNGNAGVVVAEGSNPATGNEILGNAVAGNGRIGIDLGNNGVTANDAGDADAGPNGLQNFPTITDIDRTAGGDFEVTLALASTPSTSFTVELFGNDAVDLSGFGEGARPLGDVTLTTDGDGDGRVTLTVSGADAGAALSATATGPDGTSEFSEAAVVPAISAGFAERALTVREDAGSVELVVELTAAPGDPFEATVTLTDGDSDGLGGFTSAPVAASPAGSATRFAVVVPVTDNDTAETDAEYTFELRVQSSGVDVDRSETTLTVLDDDNTPVAVTIPADGLTALAVPVGGLAASDLAAAAGADSVYAVDGTRLVALDASDALRAGQIVVVEAAGPLELSGSAAPDAVAFSGVPVADLSRALVPVGNPTDGLVALSDLGVEGGTLADVVLVFDGGAFRPISLEGLDDGTDGRTDGSGSASGSTDAVLSAFGVAILQVVPDGDAADVSVTLDAAASGADGVALSELAFAPAQGEAAVVVALTADGDGSVGDVVALRFQLGADALGDGTLGPFDGLDVSAPEADGFGGTLAALGGPGADGSALAFAALTAGDLEAGPVTVPLVVSVPVPGDYALALAAPAGDVGPRAVEIEVVDGTTGTTLDVETPYAFSVADGEDVAGRFSIQVSLGAAVSTDDGVAERSLSVWPNPTSGRVSVSVALVEAGDVRVSVYDALGREVAVLHDGPAAAGASRYEVAAGWMAPGAYVVRAVSGGAVLARALTVVR